MILFIEKLIYGLIFGGILFVIIFVIKEFQCKTQEDRLENAKNGKKLFLRCFLIAFVFCIFSKEIGSLFSPHKSIPSRQSTQSTSSSSSSHSYSSSSSSNSYDDGYDDYYENGDYDQDRYDKDSSYADGVDDAMEDE